MIDFSSIPGGTPITTQYAAQGLTVATEDANGNFGIAEAGIGYVGGISNSTTGQYPTAEKLNLYFATPSLVRSFSFNNYGSSLSGRGNSFYDAYDASGNLLGNGILNSVEGASVSINLANVSKLQFNNGTTTADNSWEFVVGSVTYTPSPTPEPSTWALMIAGLGLLVFWRNRILRA